MRVLGIDTALDRCSLAIVEGGGVLASQTQRLTKGHAEVAPLMLKSLLDETRLRAGDLDRVGVVVGPGGFTGVRIGLALARGLALGTGIAVIGVSAMAALLDGWRGAEKASGLTAIVLDARRGQVFAALYSGAREKVAPFAASPVDASRTLLDAAGESAVAVIGAGGALLPETPPHWRLAEPDAAIDPVRVARLAAAAPAPSAPPAPIYLRPPDAAPGAPSPFAGLIP